MTSYDDNPPPGMKPAGWMPDPAQKAAMLAGAEARRTEPLRPDTREEIQARLTTDPRSVALDAWHAACHEGATTRQAIERMFAALFAAGLAVVPVAERREEWGAQRTPQYGSTVAGPMWQTEARDFADGAPNDVIAGMVRRTVYVGPWEPVPDEER